ncbi:MAG: prepilin peptidase [Patescibacteria group bacterium]
MSIFLVIIFFLLGLIIGSFLNVVIYRLSTARSLGGRSACMSCQNRLSWSELVPLFSFLGLKGRCRNCQTKISIQYPLVEAITGLIFAALFFKLSAFNGQDVFFIFNLSFILAYIYYATAFSLLVVMAVYDLRHKIIPDTLSLVFSVLAFVGLFFFSNYDFSSHIPTILEFSSGVLIALPLAGLWLISSGRWMGLGDAKLALGIGWLLGLSGALSGLVIAFWSGAIIGVALIILFKNGKMGKLGMKSEIPFAPFLVFGAFLAFVFRLNLFGI